MNVKKVLDRLLMPSVAVISFILIAGCGTPNPPIQAPTVYPDVSGNWQFNVTQSSPPNFSSNTIETVTGALTSSGHKVSGVLRAKGLSLSPCIPGDTDIPVTGTVDEAGNLSLTGPIAGGTASITSTLPSFRPLPTGTFQITGGPCDQASAAVSAEQIPNMTGTFKGTLHQIFPIPSGTAPTMDVTATLAQSTAPDVHGIYSLTGTVSSTGSCITTLTFDTGQVTGVSIDGFPIMYPMGRVPLSVPSFMAFALPTSSSRSISANINNPAGCPAITYAGILTAQ